MAPKLPMPPLLALAAGRRALPLAARGNSVWGKQRLGQQVGAGITACAGAIKQGCSSGRMGTALLCRGAAMTSPCASPCCYGADAAQQPRAYLADGLCC